MIAPMLRTFSQWVVLCVVALMLGGCMQTFSSSVAGSCGVFERPPYVVLGKTRYDQDVADKFVVSGVAGCNWKPPAARPASLDAPAGRKAVVPPAKRRSLVKRIRDRILPPKIEAPAPVVVEPVPEPTPTPPPAPRRPIDELLWPSR